MKVLLFTAALSISVLAGACGKHAVSVSQTMHAPARPSNCELTLVDVEKGEMIAPKKWDILGFITFVDKNSQDPMSKENRDLARPHACKLGGSSISIWTNSTTQSNGAVANRTSSGLSYVVARPKSSKPAEPISF